MADDTRIEKLEGKIDKLTEAFNDFRVAMAKGDSKRLNALETRVRQNEGRIKTVIGWSMGAAAVLGAVGVVVGLLVG